jgi:hypothetical protein
MKKSNMTPSKIPGVSNKNSLFLSRLVVVVIIIIAAYMMLSITMERHQSFARCPNGYHISPSGSCEQVIQPSTELPRCPNGYHRSPSLICEQITPSSNNGYQSPTSPGPYQQQLPIQQQQLQNQTSSLATNPAGYPQQQQPQQQPQLQQGQPLYNPIQVVACLNHVLVDSIVKAGTSPNWTLQNNSKGVAPELNQTFIQNATQTLDSCIVPISR